MKEYQKLISCFLEKGYKTDFFSTSPPKEGILILRHDIDFDIEYAYQLSTIENALGVKSTYFFLIHSKSYNLFEQSNLDLIKLIKDSGHKISIHFDPTLYNDIEIGFQKEKALFEQIFDVKVEHTSIHRPSKYFLNNSNSIAGVDHTYHPNYVKKIKYFADSQGEFRYGNPVDSEAFNSMKTIQLLTHPIWWITKSANSISKLDEFLQYRITQFKQHMASNCKPYNEYLRGSK